jgi:thiamine biosynthesis lipoprotein
MIARARPLLGTIVSIRAESDEEGMRAAFDAIELVHALMSAHSEDGDIARIHDEAHRRPVRVHPWTFRVLRQARALSRASGGAFDVTLGRDGATWKDIALHSGRRVRLRRRACLDLGGIAKGFAVDCAISALRRAGAASGCVNAGGDLRLFGDAPQTVRVRLPGSPRNCVPLVTARNMAFATSAGYFNDEVLDARTQEPLCSGSSVTVGARSCMVADALTKAIAALGPLPALLGRFGARAYLLDRDGILYAAAR